MAKHDLEIKLAVTGVEDARAQLAALDATMTKFNVNQKGQMTATGRLNADIIRDQEAAVGGLEGAYKRAGKSQGQYFAHIARTTVQSALINQLFLQFVDVAGQAIKQVDLMSNFPATMASMGQSTGDATASLKALTTYVGEIGGNMGDAASMVTRFTGATKDVKSATAIFVGLNNALIAGDSSLQEQRQAAIQFAQALERGKPDMREWMSLTTNMSFQLAQVATEMGYVNADALGAALRSGEESMASFVTTLTKMSTGSGPIAQQAMTRMQGMQYTFNVMKNTFVQGLASIVAAFGRSNISSFFIFTTQVVMALAQAVVYVINLILSLVNLVSKLFGGPGVSKLQGDVEGVANGLGGAGDAANDLGSGLAGAGKEAKKLNKQLAGFDKMNVLNDKESGSGGGGKGGGGGGGGAGFDPGQIKGLGDMFDGLNSKIQEISKWARILAGILLGLAANALIKKIFNVDPLDAFFKKVRDVGSSIKTGLGTGISAVKRFAKDFGTEMRIALLLAKDEALKGGARIVSNLKTGMSNAVASIPEIWSATRLFVGLEVAKLVNNIKDIIDRSPVVAAFIRMRDRVTTVAKNMALSVGLTFEALRGRVVIAFDNMTESVSGRFLTFRTHVANIVSTITDPIVNKFNSTKVKVIGAMSSMALTVGMTFEAWRGRAQLSIDKITESLSTGFISAKTRVIAAVKDIGNAIIPPLKNAFSRVKSEIALVSVPLSGIGQEIGGAIVQSLKVSLGPVAGAIKDSFGTTGKIVSTALGPITTRVSTVTGKVVDLFKKMGPGISGALSSVGNLAGKGASAIAGKVKNNLRMGLIGLGTIITSAFTLVLTQGPEALVEKFNGFIQMLLNGPQALASLITAVQTMFATVAAQTEPIIAAVVSMVTTLANAIIDNAPKMINSFFDAVLRMLGELTKPETVEKIIVGAVTLIENIITGLSKILPKILTAMTTAIDKLISMITEPKMLTMIINSAIELLLKILLAIIDALPKIINGMVKMLTTLIAVITRPDILDKIINAAILLIVTIALALIENLPKIIDAGIKLIVALAKALTRPETLSALLRAVWQIVVAIYNAFLSPDALRKFGDMGVDLVKGLWGGITSMVGWIGGKLKEFGGNVLNGLKDFFGIKSPSRVMRDQVGKMLGYGLAEGITDSTSEAVGAAEDAASGVMSVFDNLSTSMDDLSTDFSIKGALDKSLDVYTSGNIPEVTAVDYQPQNNDKLVDLIAADMGSRKNGEQPMQLVVQIGEDKIATKIIDLINDRTQMSGRNAIYV